jgi:hypothetical protein
VLLPALPKLTGPSPGYEWLAETTIVPALRALLE